MLNFCEGGGRYFKEDTLYLISRRKKAKVLNFSGFKKVILEAASVSFLMILIKSQSFSRSMPLVFILLR